MRFAIKTGEAGVRWRRSFWTVLCCLWVLPAIAMRFSRQFVWGIEDFAAWALLLSGLGLCVELSFRVTSAPMLRAMLVGAAVAVAGVIWADAAVGIL